MLKTSVLSAVLIAATGLLPLIPAEHAHDVERNGQHHIVVHQHSPAHRLGHAPLDRESRKLFDHPDDPVLTVASVFTTSTPQTAPVPDQTSVALDHPPLQRRAGLLWIAFVDHVIHGPPRAPTSLRAPPAFPS